MKFKKDYDKLSAIVQENKEGLNSLAINLNESIKNSLEGDENLKKKFDILKKHTDDKMLELNTKLELFLNNLGGKNENGEKEGTNLQKKFDLSGLNDFMQKLIGLENRFEDFVSSSKINYIHDQLKYLDDKKAEKTDLQKANDDIKDLQDNKENIDNINIGVESINKQIEDINTELEKMKNISPIMGEGIYPIEGKKIDIENKISLDAKSLDIYTSKYLLKSKFDDFLKINREKINKMMDEIDKIKNQIIDLTNSLNNKAESEDLSELRDFLTIKLEELVNECTKKFSDKNETLKYLKYLEDQIKDLYLTSKSKSDSHIPENWLLATKPIGGFSCAACESYIGDLKSEKEKFLAWNKLPTKENGEKLYRMGNGFSKMLSMLNFDSNGNVYLNPNAETYNNSEDDENKNDKRKREKNLSTLLIKNKSQNDGMTIFNQNRFSNNNLGKKTQNNFFKKEEIKNSFLPKIKKEILSDRENGKENEENPKITKIFKKSHSKLYIKENN